MSSPAGESGIIEGRSAYLPEPANEDGLMPTDDRRAHDHRHAFAGLNPLEEEGLMVVGRRNMLKAGLMGMAGLSLPGLLRGRALASEAGRPVGGRKSVILLWMTGGPSQI